MKWLAIAAPSGAAYAFGAFLIFAIWCGAARGVDPGIGDSWCVPLEKGYVMGMTDTSTEAFIQKKESDATLVSGINEIGEKNGYVFGLARNQGGFLLNTVDGTLHHDQEKTALFKRLRVLGPANAQMRAVDDFYSAKRGYWLDRLALSILGIPILAGMVWTLRKAW